MKSEYEEIINTYKVKLGEKFKEIRQYYKNSQDVTSEKMELEMSNFISSVERGVHFMSITNLVKAAAVFKIHLFEFFIFSNAFKTESEKRDEIIRMLDHMPAADIDLIHSTLINYIKRRF